MLAGWLTGWLGWRLARGFATKDVGVFARGGKKTGRETQLVTRLRRRKDVFVDESNYWRMVDICISNRGFWEDGRVVYMALSAETGREAQW